MPSRSLFIVLCGILLSRLIQAQPAVMRFDHVSIEQGLSDLTVFCFAQDSIGFLWFGTSDGLNKYDGYTFTVYRNNPRDSTSLASGAVNDLCVDRSGTLWIATTAGLSILHPDSSAPHRFPNDVLFGTPSSKNVTRLALLRSGNILVGTFSGLFLYNERSRTFSQFSVDTISSIAVTSLCETSDGILWIAAAHRYLIAFDPATKSIRRYMFYRYDRTRMLDNGVNDIKQDRSGRIWVAANDGLYRLDTASQSFIPVSEKQGIGHDIVFDILEDHNGRVWVGTFHLGVALYRPGTDDFVRFTHDPEDPQSINSDRLTRMFEDRGGVLWFGTYRAGLNRYNAKRSSFKHFVTRKTPGKGISLEGVYAILEDKSGDVWLGTYGGGLNRYTPGRDRYTYYRYQSGKPGTISSDNVLSIVEKEDGNLWVAGSGGLDRLDKNTGRFVHFPMTNEKLRFGSNREVKTVLQGSDGYVWFGTFIGGLQRLDPKTGKTVLYEYLGGDSVSPGSPGVWALCEDGRGRMWIGTYGAGLFVMDRKTETFRRFVADETHPLTTLRSNGIYTLLKDDHDVLWIGTMGGGLARLDLATEEIRSYTVEDGLPNNFVKGIHKDGHGNLWLSTDFGLSRFDPVTGTFTNLRAEDGLMGNVFLSGAHFLGRSGRMYFGGEEGAVSFHPDSIHENAHVPPIVISEFRVLDHVYPLYLPRSFSYNENTVAFEFVALDFTLPEKNRFAYMLEGLDHRWIQAGTRRYANYTHLDPGTYTFKVKGSNNDGIWNDTGVALSFTIRPPWWETWWFRIGAGLVFIAAAAWFYNYRVNRLLEIERLRVKIASDLHDDIGSSLTRISIQSELIQEGVEPQEVNSYLKNIASTSRELVSTMSDIVWSIDARNDLVENLIFKIRDSAVNTLSPKGIEVRFAHSGLNLKQRLSVDKRENIYLICKEAINNIAKHSGSSNVSIVIRNDHDKFTIVIHDDGKGIGSGERLNGHGVKNMRMRAGRIGGTVEFIPDAGTRVVLTTRPL